MFFQSVVYTLHMWYNGLTVESSINLNLPILVSEDCLTVPGSMQGQVGLVKPQGFIPDISLLGLILGGTWILVRIVLSLRFTMSDQPNVVDLSFFKLWILIEQKLCLECQRIPPSVCKDKGIRKLEFVFVGQIRFKIKI